VQPGLAKVTGEMEDLQKKYTALSRENEAMGEDRANMLAQVKNLLAERNRAVELSASLDKNQSELAEMRKTNEELKNGRTDVQAKLEGLTGERDRLLKERDDLKVLYEKTRKEHVIEDLKDELAKLQKEKGAVENRLRQAESAGAQLKSQAAKQQADIEGLNAQLKNYKKNYAVAQMKNKKLESAALHLPAKFAEIARQNKRLIKETAEMHYNLGVFYSKGKNYERAIAEFEKVLDIDPNDSYAHFNLGYIYAEYLVNRKNSVEHFRHFLRLAKSDDKDVDWVKKYLITWETYEGKKSMP
jgi:chromosome segregation ATPase